MGSPEAGRPTPARAERPSLRFALVLALGAALFSHGCGPRPSATPLGVGPLPPGAKLAAELRRETRLKRLTRRPRADTTGTTDTAGAGTLPVDEGEPGDAPVVTASAAPTAPSGTPAAGATGGDVSLPDPSGDYRGDDVSLYRLGGLPDRKEKDPNARVRVQGAGKAFDFALVDSSNGKDICSLTGTLEGRTATITVGQRCFEQDEGDAASSATVTRGTATFDGARLVLDLMLDFALRVGDDEHTGTLEYHFDGARP